MLAGLDPYVAGQLSCRSRTDGWVSQLNGHDLAGWYSMLQKSGKGVAEKRNMVVMEEGMLHIMGNEIGKEPADPGYLATNQEFENLHIRLELTGI
jgi:hypothetical protein